MPYVNVINVTMGGTFFLEGRARVVKVLDEERSLVDFEEGSGPVERAIDPCAQGEDVAHYIADLNASTPSREDTP